MSTNQKHTPFKIRLASGGNTGKEIIILDCAQQIELGELYACTSAEEKRLLLQVNTLPEVTAQRDTLLAACREMVSAMWQHFEYHHDGEDWEHCQRVIDQAKAAIALCEKGGQ